MFKLKIRGIKKKYHNVRFHVLDGVTDELRTYSIVAKWNSKNNKYTYCSTTDHEQEIFDCVKDIRQFMIKDGKSVYIKPFEEDLKD